MERASVHKGGKRYMKLPKPEYSVKEDVPLSHMGIKQKTLYILVLILKAISDPVSSEHPS